MARTQRVVITDDLDGEEITLNDVRNFRFSVEGVQYKMDLREDTYEKALNLPLVELIEHAAREGGRRTRGTGPAPTAGSRTKEIRKWAGHNGYTVSEKGRIPRDVVAAYDAAHA